MGRVSHVVKGVGWLALALVAYSNWKADSTLYGLEPFHLTRALWQSADSLFMCKALAFITAMLEGAGLIVLSPAIFLLSRLDLSPALRDVIVGANAIAIYVIVKWNNPPKQKLLAQLNSSTAGEFINLGKRLTAAPELTHLRGSLAWLCDELGDVVALDKRLASIALCRHVLQLHLYVLTGAVGIASSAPTFDELAATAKRQGLQPEPASRQLWEMAGALLNDLFSPESRSLETTYTSLLVGTLGVAKGTAELLGDKAGS